MFTLLVPSGFMDVTIAEVVDILPSVEPSAAQLESGIFIARDKSSNGLCHRHIECHCNNIEGHCNNIKSHCNNTHKGKERARSVWVGSCNTGHKTVDAHTGITATVSDLH